MNSSKDTIENFAKRKAEHITISLQPENEALGHSGFDKINLLHEALPDVNFEDTNITTKNLGIDLPSPFLVSSMTAGHKQGEQINKNIASACEKTGWLMGVGSQRRQLFDNQAKQEWIALRSKYPNTKMLGNIGMSQIITTSPKDIKDILSPINANALFVHANPLQECIQVEGTPQYKGWFNALSNLIDELDIPIIIKETGCGFSEKTLLKLNNLNIHAVDVSGFGGTHWGRIEGARATDNRQRQITAKTFANWGISTVDSLLLAQNLDLNYEIWGSGGIRNGLDAAKALALGANIVGFAKPILEKALIGTDAIVEYMRQVEFELKTALFCTGNKNLESLQRDQVWQTIQK